MPARSASSVGPSATTLNCRILGTTAHPAPGIPPRPISAWGSPVDPAERRPHVETRIRPRPSHRRTEVMPDILTRKATSVPGRIVFLAGGALILWSAYIHFHLWQSVGYKHLPTIGPLFLLQWIGGIVVGLAVVALPRLWVALGGIGFALSTMAGFLLCTALPKGLFNFKE